MPLLYDNGLYLVRSLQGRFADPFSERFFLWFSHVGSPTNGFFIYFPLAYGFSSFAGIQALWVAVLSEWLNVILKWCFNDDRPYWWITQKQQLPGTYLKQWEETCESGPGFPSGHVMCTAAAAILFALNIKEYITQKIKSRNCSLILNLIMWVIVSGVLFFIGISRIYIATHFPHQVTAGFIVGILVALTVRMLGRGIPYAMHSSINIPLSFFLLGSGYLVYRIIIHLGHDPMASVDKALENCHKKEWVHLNTTIFYSLIRDSASLCGLGIVAIFSKSFNIKERNGVFVRVAFSAVGTVVMILYERLSLPDNDVSLFYILAYFKYLLVPIFVCMVLPIVMNCFISDTKNKQKAS